MQESLSPWNTHVTLNFRGITFSKKARSSGEKVCEKIFAPRKQISFWGNLVYLLIFFFCTIYDCEAYACTFIHVNFPEEQEMI